MLKTEEKGPETGGHDAYETLAHWRGGSVSSYKQPKSGWEVLWVWLYQRMVQWLEEKVKRLWAGLWAEGRLASSC